MNRAYLALMIAVIITSITVVHMLFVSSNRKINVIIATTTSLYSTGILDFFADGFKKLNPNVEIIFIAVGSGAALKYAEKGDACAVFTHAPSLEKKYLDVGVIENHRIFAYNVFIIVGPKDDPANISRSNHVLEAFRRIYHTAKERKVLFVSRGDRSGTHIRELFIWRRINITPSDNWYIECGCGSDEALRIANELKAYTLTDIATFVLLKEKGLVQNVAPLYVNYTDYLTLNIYSMYIAKNCNNSRRWYIEQFLDYVYKNQQYLIEEFNNKLNRNGKVFYPAREREDIILKLWEEFAKGEVLD